MSVVAKFTGTCPTCGVEWEPGVEIALGPGGWQHVECVAPDYSLAQLSETTTSEPLDAVVGPACTVCWLVHPENGCDR